MMIRPSLMLATALVAAPAVAQPTPMASEAVAPSKEEAAPALPDQVQIERDHADRMTVEVSVAGTGPYRFLVDTGSERTVISRELANRLKLADGERAMLHSVVGANSVETVVIPHLTVSANTLRVLDAPALKESNIGADGMLGIDSLRAQSVSIDFKTNTMAITPSMPSAKSKGGDDMIVVKARSRNGRLIFTDAEIDGRKVTVIVDTGSEVSIGNMALKAMLDKRKIAYVPGPVTIETVTGEKMEAQVSRIPNLEIGGVTLNALAIAFTDAHIFKKLDLVDRPSLLLGMNAMRAFDRISIDFAQKKVRFVLPGSSMIATVKMAALLRD